ncbi:MAG: Txe/YoeB family addiction module toxin [Bacteroidetes bacterium]|nr:Txe/YoeB family addiction module toxin [Bacteroidota bacterium]MBU1371168.1 Txe/YoeB family addiction module toxin [Bacteroidota bacterium]MBU1486174.1 Txe/YoeB family addiction module toxin [Bacteroidota bacterium]MBU1759423.1 Txe/YoeB family addiction module toxin [Bacteroidota bacterium]MBU2046109.1 Txe/YoeB family addiction module toxin [Bacteroidota bacterium]
MGKYTLNLSARAIKDLKVIYRSGDKLSIKRIEQIFEELAISPKEGIGKPEMLKHNYSGFWSRRINPKDRLIYKIEEEIITIFVIAAKGHYDDK